MAEVELENENKSFAEKFYAAFNVFKHDPTLKDSEKLFLTYVVMYDNGQGLFASNSWFRKELGWKERKTTEVISKLFKKKRIMIMRKHKNSPDRYIFIYNTHTIETYKSGAHLDSCVLDFEE